MEQFLTSKEVAQAISLCHLVSELIEDHESFHKSGVLKNILMKDFTTLPNDKVLHHALQMIVDFVYDEKQRASLEHLLKVGKVMQPNDPFLRRFKKFLSIMDSYMDSCIKHNYLSPDIIKIESNGILFKV
jgi:hypothetical protein